MDQHVTPRALLYHSNWLLFARCFLFLVVALLMVTDARAIVTNTYGAFTVNFYNTGETFDGYTGTGDWTPVQMADVAASISTWDAKIGNTAGRPIRMDVIWSDFSGQTLGGSYSATYSNNSTKRAWNAGEGIWRDGWTGGTSSAFDTRIVYDSDAAGFNWNFGAGVPGAKIDFRSVVTHEIGHSLGFDTTYDSSTDTFWSGGITAWDSFLVDQNLNRPKAGTTGTLGNFDQIGNVNFTGANAKAANGGADVAVFAPDPFSSGSSLAHLDYPTFPNALMNPYVATGAIHREPTTLEWAMMKDMGWTIVPEPGTCIMLLGLAGTLFLCRGRVRLFMANTR